MSNRYRPRPSLLWPLLLIGVGVILLLDNLDILPGNTLNILWRFWPLVLVIIGLDLLIGRRSALGSITSSVLVLILFGCVIGFIFLTDSQTDFLSGLDVTQLQQSTISTPVADFETANVKIDWASGPAKLFALSDSNKLIDGEIHYFGTLYFEVKPEGRHAEVNLDTRVEGFPFSMNSGNQDDGSWKIGLHPRVRLNLTLDASSGSGDYDLRNLQIERLDIDGGSGPLTITLPEQGQVQGIIDGGSGPIRLTLPEQMEAKIILDDGSGSFTPSSRFSQPESDDDTTIWTTPGFQSADQYIELSIDQGSGSIQIQ